MADEFAISDPNWRTHATNEQVVLPNGFIATEYEIYLAIEKLSVYLTKTEDRNPTVTDIRLYILMMRGPAI